VAVTRPHARLASRLLARLCRTGLITRRVSLKGFTFEMILLSRASWRKATYTSGKTSWRLRQIDLRNGQSYLVRPSFLMPYLAGRTEEVQAPLFSASSPSPTGR
jgi:hypothetical protein